MEEQHLNKTTKANKRANVFQIAIAVLWGFLGVRKHAKWQEDAQSLTPGQIIMGGLIGAVVFVLVLVLIVSIVIKSV